MEALSLLDAFVLLAASAAASAVNAVAGGGTLLTFPTLVGLGLTPQNASITSTVGLAPGMLGAMWGYRRELRRVKGWLPWVLPASVVGSVFGALLLIRTPPETFGVLAPWLILAATLLFILQGPIARNLPMGPARQDSGNMAKTLVVLLQLAVGIYGGYFGAGMSILILASMGLLHMPSIHEANAVKTLAAGFINVVAALYFMVTVQIHWTAVLTMLLGAILGGYLGADFARRLPSYVVRGIVIAVGLGSALAIGFWK